MSRVLVAMSGGVDSSVSAALLVEQGHEVIGATMQTWPDLVDEREALRYGGCCSIGAVEDARRVATQIGIPYYVLNFQQHFQRRVIDDFVSEYLAGRTPNPCIRCNRHVKFERFLEMALELDCDYIATGHYARVHWDGERGRHVLRRGRDGGKDQTYALYNLTQAQLGRSLFPVGELEKSEVRRIATRLGLEAVAEKPDSQEICFVLDDDYGRFLEEKVPDQIRPGDILDQAGRVVGRHRGIVHYTIGQRRGLGLNLGRPAYVTDIDPARNTITVGALEDAWGSALVAHDVNWVSIDGPREPRRVTAKIRYGAVDHPATLFPTPNDPDRIRLEFDEPEWAITPGQAVVFYDGEEVLGGGTILRAD